MRKRATSEPPLNAPETRDKNTVIFTTDRGLNTGEHLIWGVECRGSGGRPGPPDQDHTARSTVRSALGSLGPLPDLLLGSDTVHSLISIRRVPSLCTLNIFCSRVAAPSVCAILCPTECLLYSPARV